MALHKNFPKDPFEILNPEIRWFPATEDLREKGPLSTGCMCTTNGILYI